MATIKSYTDLQQSRKLAEILPLESADMYYILMPDGVYNNFPLNGRKTELGESTDIPCWSLSALLGVLPLVDFTMPKLIGTPKTLYRCIYNDGLMSHAYDNAVDACVDMIVRLSKNGLI